jgi:hypothetical protein
MNTDAMNRLFGLTSPRSDSARTDLSRRREAEQREQRARNGDVDPQGRRY